MDTVCIAAITYLEPAWRTTAACIRRCEVDVFWADRRGVGSMARAYNECFNTNRLADRFKYVWFLSNVEFEDGVLSELLRGVERSGFAALHPSFDSDHWHTRPAKSPEVFATPFVEFTAPLVQSDIFAAFPLDERMPYWGHDLDWGHRVRQAGHTIGVHHGTRVSHSYIRHDQEKHPATLERARQRAQHDAATRRQLRHKYGRKWRDVLHLEPVMSTEEQAANRKLNFWVGFVKTTRFLDGWVANVRTPELRQEVADFVLSHQHDSVLDVGSGVVSILNGLVPTQNLRAVDPLGARYATIFDYQAHGLQPPQACRAEDMAFQDQFDIVHMSNALDHCRDPVIAFTKLCDAQRAGGYLVIQSFENEATQQNWAGMHQWNLRLEADQLLVANRDQLFRLADPRMRMVSARSLPLETRRRWVIWIAQKAGERCRE